VEIRQSRGDGAGGERRRVELMFGVKYQRYVNGAAVQLVGLLTEEQMEKVAGGIVVIGFCDDALAAGDEVVPIEQHAAEAGGEPVGHRDLRAPGILLYWHHFVTS